MTVYSKGSLYAADPKSDIVLYVLQDGFCNSRCKHCYMLSQNKIVRKRDLETARKDLETLVGSGKKVHLRGTEVLLNPEYLSLFPLIKQDYIQTNGRALLKKPTLVGELKNAGIEKIMFTYPGEPADLVDFSKELVEEAIGFAEKNGFKTVVDFIITKDVVKSFENDKNYFRKIAEKTISFGSNELRLVRLISLSPALNQLTPSDEDMQKIAIESVKLELEYKEKLDVTRTGQFGFYDLRRKLKEKYFGIKVPNPEDSGIMDCPAGKKLFVIDVDDGVYPCLYLMNQEFKMGQFINGKINITKSEISPGKIHLPDCPAAVIHKA